jgi:nicotinamide mononucleotide transporter PnuC
MNDESEIYIMFKDILEGLGVGVFLTGITYYIGSIMGWIGGYSILEVSGVLFNYACVWLVVRQKIANWPLGIIAVVLLGWLFFNIQLYASMALHIIYFLPIQIWGWYNWLYGGEEKTELKVSLMKPVELTNILVHPMHILMLVFSF